MAGNGIFGVVHPGKLTGGTLKCPQKEKEKEKHATKQQFLGSRLQALVYGL